MKFIHSKLSWPGSEFCLSTALFVSSPPRSKLDLCLPKPFNYDPCSSIADTDLFTLGGAGLDESEAWPEKLNTSETFPPGGVFLKRCIMILESSWRENWLWEKTFAIIVFSKYFLKFWSFQFNVLYPFQSFSLNWHSILP